MSICADPANSCPISPDRAAMIANHPNRQKGQLTYYKFCAHYHGYAGECQIGAMTESAKSFGLHTVPAHDATGHTWKHFTQLLSRAILNGTDNLLNQNPMSPFGDRLSEPDVDHLIAYMSLWWTVEQRTWQAQVTERRVKHSK